MLPGLHAACEEWQPDLVLRDPAEYNARRVAAVGAGVAVVPGPRDASAAITASVDPSVPRAAVEDVLGDDAYRRAACLLAAEMHALAPADRAVQALPAQLMLFQQIVVRKGILRNVW
jgi:hypothetical protein